MPWRVTDVMDQKISFVVRAVGPGVNMSALCHEYGISRPTGYTWLKRYREASSVTGLRVRSRRPSCQWPLKMSRFWPLIMSGLARCPASVAPLPSQGSAPRVGWPS